MTKKIIGDVYGIVLNALQNWTIPDASIYTDVDKFEENDLTRKIHETNLKKIIVLDKTIDLDSINAGEQGTRVLPQKLQQYDSKYYIMKCKTRHVVVDLIRKVVSMSFYESYDKKFTFLASLLYPELSTSLLRYTKNNPLNLEELIKSSIDDEIQMGENIWNNLDESVSLDRTSSEKINIYELIQNCIECGANQPATIRECIDCKKALPFCQICKRGYSTKDQLSSCPKCANVFHRIHFYAAIQANGKCPSCREVVTLTSIESH